MVAATVHSYFRHKEPPPNPPPLVIPERAPSPWDEQSRESRISTSWTFEEREVIPRLGLVSHKNTPFIQDIISEELLERFWPLQIDKYTRSTNPEEYLGCFENVTLLHQQLNGGLINYCQTPYILLQTLVPYFCNIFLVANDITRLC